MFFILIKILSFFEKRVNLYINKKTDTKALRGINQCPSILKREFPRMRIINSVCFILIKILSFFEKRVNLYINKKDRHKSASGDKSMPLNSQEGIPSYENN